MRDFLSPVTHRLGDLLLSARSAALASSNTRAKDKRRILILDDLVPDPLFGAGYPRADAIVQSLVEAGYAIDFFPMEATADDVERMTVKFSGAVRFHAAQGVRGLRRLLWQEGAAFDAAIVSRPRPMQVFEETRWRRTRQGRKLPIIYDAEALLAPREVARRELFGPPCAAGEYRAALEQELALTRGATAILAVSETDAAVIGSVVDVPAFVLSHAVRIRLGTPDFADRRDFLFVGRLAGLASRSPNVDSILWFATEVMPHLDALIGADYRVHIGGYVEAPEITALASDRIVLHGVVDDLDSLYDSCRVFIAPTRYAAGIPLKVLEAMGAGIPCVATPLLAEQLAAGGDALATGGSPADFAAQCARLYAAEDIWSAARDGGSEHVRQACSPAVFDRAVRAAFDHVLPT